ncbi:MAG: ABC transporter ATP-binding protein [Burkholderia sp.]
MPVATLGRDTRPPEAGAPAHPPLHVRGLTKRYTSQGRTRTVLDGIELDVAPGEFVSVVGPSGCGKSTLLRVLAGLDADYDGSLRLGAAELRGPSLSRGIVFQDHRLLPWLTLEQNVALALKNVDLEEAAKRERVRAQLELVGLDGSRDAWPGELSGGMAQRGAIARALVTEPDVLLLDEPLSALDALTRARLQDALLAIWQRQRVTMVLVTHDIEEALYLSQRIVVLSANPGRVERIVPVPIDYPRDRASYAFADMRREVGAAIAA